MTDISKALRLIILAAEAGMDFAVVYCCMCLWLVLLSSVLYT